MLMVLISSCIVWFGIRVKEQTAELVDINWLDLLVVVVINSSFGSELSLQTSQCDIADYRTEYLPVCWESYM